MSKNLDAMLLTSSGVADLLDVHPSTVKRWCDDGSLGSEKTEGGHRRIHLTDALGTGRSKGIPTFLDPFHPWEANVWLAVSEVEEEGSFRRLHNLALGWLSKGDTDLLGRLLYELARRPKVSLTHFLDVGIRGLMVRVGEEWMGGRLVVGEEHMATQVVLEVLIRLRDGWGRLGSTSREPNETLPVAVVGAMEGDRHDLGAQAVRVLLERAGWRVYYLGADVPVEEFAEIQRAQGATLVCISFSPENTLPDLQRAIRVLSEFYRPERPYALALGGSLGDLPEHQLSTEPFEAFSLSRSALEFESWLGTLSYEDDSLDPRRVA